MVAIRPFRGLRYNPQRINDLSAVLAPPYDVIDAEEQERLYQASPHNVVRLILGKQYATDTEEENRYTRSRRDFTAWRRAGLLILDPTPALYLIQHAVRSDGATATRLGFIALLGLEEATPREVYRHEATLAAPKADRTKLLEAVPANLEPIFCVYPDDQGAIHALLTEVTRRDPPAAQARIGGDEVRLWAVTDPGVLERVARHLRAVSVLIADGHHRFEVGYANRARYGALMAYFVSMRDPALAVRPIHRVVTHPRGLDLGVLREGCAVDPASGQQEAAQWLKASSGAGRFAVCDGRAWHRVAITDEALARWLMSPTVPPPVALLDVSILHSCLLPRLGVRPLDAAAHGDGGAAEISYTADADKAAAMAGQAPQRSAWLLRGIPLQQVYALAAQGLTLAPKSTYFYPKVPSGLVINPHTE